MVETTRAEKRQQVLQGQAWLQPAGSPTLTARTFDGIDAAAGPELRDVARPAATAADTTAALARPTAATGRRFLGGQAASTVRIEALTIGATPFRLAFVSGLSAASTTPTTRCPLAATSCIVRHECVVSSTSAEVVGATRGAVQAPLGRGHVPRRHRPRGAVPPEGRTKHPRPPAPPYRAARERDSDPGSAVAR